jgi:hypothetical protein
MQKQKFEKAQDQLIAAGQGVRYVFRQLKVDGEVEMFDDGPFGNDRGKTANVRRQALLAALREQDPDGHAMLIPIRAEVTDGRGGIQVVDGRKIPMVYDSAVQREQPFAVADEEWLAANLRHNSDRMGRAAVGKQQVKAAVEKLAIEVVAVAEKAGTSAPKAAVEKAAQKPTAPAA